MAEIAQFESLAKAAETLEESKRIGQQAVSITTQIVQLSKQWSALQALSKDADDQAVFAARFTKAAQAAKQQTGSLSAAERQLVQQFFGAIFT